MLEYEWGNQPILLTGEEMNQEPNQTHQIFNPCDSNDTDLPANFRSPNFSHSFHSQQSQPSLQPFVESRNYVLSHSFLPSASLSSTSGCSQAGISPRNEVDGIFAHDIVKNEDVYGNHFAARIGLNLGGRTYFSPEDDFVTRLYQRNRPISPGSNSPRCQAEGCNADLTHSKHYHRRHKVCEFHSKAPTVIAGGLPQRFCQQCSRFHRLTEFDQGKRSCRKRLAEHNRRRRKNQQPGQPESHNPQSPTSGAPASKIFLTNTTPLISISQTTTTNPGVSLADSLTDSVTIAVSPPGVNLLYSGQPSWQSSRHSSSCSPVMAFPADDSFRPYGRQIPNLEWNEEQ